MRARVIAVLLARRGGEVLQQTLDALAQQTRQPDLLVVVDAAESDTTTAQLAAIGPTQFVTAGSSVPFGELVHRGLGALPELEHNAAPYGGVEEWLWLLRHDTAPDPRALERLLAAVEVAPSVAVAGPKQLDAAHPTMIVGYGETMTEFGAAIGLAERELDQAQHDRTSDVLAVGEAGMLVRRAVYNQVEGFDPGLRSVDAALDLCVRIRLAGHRVIGVPQARLFVAESTVLAGRPGARPRASERTLARLRRTAQLHRRLVYAPALAVPLHWLSLLPLAALRSLGHLLRKRPQFIGGEFAAALAVAFSGSAVPGARRRLARARQLGWGAVDPLRLPRDEVRQRRAIARDARLAAHDDPRPPRPSFVPGGALVVAGLTMLSAALYAPLLGAPALLGGAFVPLAADLSALLVAVERTAIGAADPFAFVLALLGVLTPWQPSLSLVVLVVVAMPLAGLGAWWAAAELVRRPAPAALIAALWGLAPALLVAVSAGRPAAIIAHIALPWLLAAALRSAHSWSATAVAGLLTAVVVAAAPSLIAALVGGWVVLMVSAPRAIGRLLTLPVPALALFAPLIVDHLRRGTALGLLADPGLPVPPATVAPSGLLPDWLDLGLLLWIPVGILALIGLALPGGRRALGPLTLTGLGIVTAWAIAQFSVSVAAGEPVTLDTGPALSLAALGLTLAAAIGVDALLTAGAARAPAAAGARRAARMLAASLATLAVLAAAVAAAPAATAVLAGTAEVRSGEPRTLPALVAAEALTDPGIGTLVVTPLESAVAARVDRGAGRTLAEQRTLVATRVLDGSATAEQQTLATVTANLVAPSGLDLTPELDALDIRYVLLQGGAATDIVAALDGNALLAPVGDTDVGRLYRVVAADTSRTAPAERPASTAVVLGVQLSILALTLLLAIPTSLRPRRAHTDPDELAGPARTFDPGDDDD